MKIFEALLASEALVSLLSFFFFSMRLRTQWLLLLMLLFRMKQESMEDTHLVASKTSKLHHAIPSRICLQRIEKIRRRCIRYISMLL